MANYLDLEVILTDAEPKIWRRFLIKTDATFMDLHEAIQTACGWQNCHLFTFRVGNGQAIAGLPDDDDFDDPEPDANRIELSSFFQPSQVQECIYEYDFGDSWEHNITLVEAVDLDEVFSRRLFDGARAFPPEDCGGLRGYEDCVKVAQGFEGKTIFGPAADLRDWLGHWDPERFNLAETKRIFDR